MSKERNRPIALIDRSVKRERKPETANQEYQRLKNELAELQIRNNWIRSQLTLARSKSFKDAYNRAVYEKSQGKNVTDKLLEMLMEGMSNSERIFELNTIVPSKKTLLEKPKAPPRMFSNFFVEVVKELLPENHFKEICMEAQRREEEYNEKGI